MKTARILVISGTLATALALAVLLFLSGAEPERPMSFEEFAAESGSTDASGEGRPGLYVTDLIEPGRGDAILDDVRAGRIDLLSELRRLRSYCPEEGPARECDAMVIDFLNRLPEPDGGKLVQLFESYREYESERERGRLAAEAASADAAARRELLRKLRREIFGEEDAALIFGLSEAHVDFQQVVRRFAGDDPKLAGLSAAERLAEFETARARVFGPYHETLLERQPANTALGFEVLVRQSELENLGEAERQRVMHAIRRRHLGADRADAILADEERAAAAAAEKNANLEAFLAAEQELLAKNPDLPVAERLAKIEQLRSDYFGERPGEN